MNEWMDSKCGEGIKLNYPNLKKTCLKNNRKCHHLNTQQHHPSSPSPNLPVSFAFKSSRFWSFSLRSCIVCTCIALLCRSLWTSVMKIDSTWSASESANADVSKCAMSFSSAKIYNLWMNEWGILFPKKWRRNTFPKMIFKKNITSPPHSLTCAWSVRTRVLLVIKSHLFPIRICGGGLSGSIGNETACFWHSWIQLFNDRNDAGFVTS